MIKVSVGAGKRILKSVLLRKSIPCLWSKSPNWGDALTPYIVKVISGRKARYEESPFVWKNLVVGSILDRADKYSIVWGAGMIAPDKFPRQTPHVVHAVRGPLTRDQLLKSGIHCPETYGDPALLMPRYFNPPRTVKWTLGVIPHCVDKDHPWINKIRTEDNIKVIDICSETEVFIREILACEAVISSSLHGLICSDAYQIPNRRMILSNKLLGGNFKFHDYYKSISVDAKPPIKPSENDRASDFISSATTSSIKLDLDALLKACPFHSS